MTAVEELLAMADKADARGEANTAAMFRRKAEAGEERAKITLSVVRFAGNWARKELAK